MDGLAITRGLLPYAIRRAEMDPVELLFDEEQSITRIGTVEYVRFKITTGARVVALTTNEIERLNEGGITMDRGYSVSVSHRFKMSPVKIRLKDGTLLTIMKFTQDQGASVWVCDCPSLGSTGTGGYYPEYSGDPYEAFDPSCVPSPVEC